MKFTASADARRPLSYRSRIRTACALLVAAAGNQSGKYENGSIVWSGTPFGMYNGLQVTFKTVTCPAEITARSGCVRTA